MAIRGQHNHDSDLLKSWVTKNTMEVVASRAPSVTVPPRAILQELQTRANSSPSTSQALSLLPSPSTIARKVQRERKRFKADLGSKMTNWKDYQVPLKYVLTGDQQEPFCAIQVDFDFYWTLYFILSVLIGFPLSWKSRQAGEGVGVYGSLGQGLAELLHVLVR